MKNLGPVAWCLLHVWFFLFMTRTEFPSFGTFAGLSYMVRGLAGFMLIFQMLYLHRSGVRMGHVAVALIFTLVYMLTNISDPSVFLIITGFGIMTGLIFGAMVHNTETVSVFKLLVRNYILVNVFGLLLALVCYYGAGLEIDFHSVLFPWSSARVREFMGYYRVTGFQIEPGTYTATMYFCALVSAVLRGRLFGRLEGFAILTTVATMSAWSAFAISSYFAGCLIEALLDKRRNQALFKGVAILVAIVPFLGLINLVDVKNTAYIQYFLDRFTTEDASGSMVMKLQAWNAWSSHLGTEMLKPHPLSQSFCNVCGSPQDLGTLINMLWFMGIVISVPLLLWLSAMALRHAGPGLLVASLPLIVAKFYFYDPALWFYFGLLMFFPLRNHMDLTTRRNDAGAEYSVT